MQLSKFNYYHLNDNYWVLYNYYKGLDSICTINKNIDIEGLLSGTRPQNISNKVIQELKNKGYFLDDNVDQQVLLKARYMKKVMDGQLQLTIMPTEECNFRCSYCYETYNNGSMSKKVQNALLKNIQKNIYKYRSVHVSWFGGEPLLAYDTIIYLSNNIKQICKTAHRNYSASITTNGYLLTVDKYLELVKNNVFFYQITLDGIEKYHDAQRMLTNQKGTFNTIHENLMTIKKQVDPIHLKTNIMLRMNFTRSMLNGIDEILDFFGKEYSDSSRFTFLFRNVGDYGGDNIDNIRHNLLKPEELYKIYKAAYESKYQFNISTQVRMIQDSTCYAGKANHYVIGADGVIYKCTVDMNGSKVGQLKESGNLFIDEYLNELWFTNGINNLFDKCTKCTQAPACVSLKCPKKTVNGLRSDCNFIYDSNLMKWILNCYIKINNVLDISE